MFQWYWWKRGIRHTPCSEVPTLWLNIDLQRYIMWLKTKNHIWMTRLGKKGLKLASPAIKNEGEECYLCFDYFILCISNYPSIPLKILCRWYVIYLSGGHYLHIMASSIMCMSLKSSKFFLRRGLRLESRGLEKELSIKYMIISRQGSTIIQQDISWCWSVGRYMNVSTSEI